jgi:hypothetical protein
LAVTELRRVVSADTVIANGDFVMNMIMGFLFFGLVSTAARAGEQLACSIMTLTSNLDNFDKTLLATYVTPPDMILIKKSGHAVKLNSEELAKSDAKDFDMASVVTATVKDNNIAITLGTYSVSSSSAGRYSEWVTNTIAFGSKSDVVILMDVDRKVAARCQVKK